MSTKETMKIVKAFESILEDINDETKIQIPIKKYLYTKEDKMIAVPEILWCIVMYLGEEVEKENSLNYQAYTVGCNEECVIKCEDKNRWFKEKLVFVSNSDLHINIMDKPRNKIKCGGQNAGDPNLQICALFLSMCLYKYDPQIRCYVTKELYRWSMFVLFLYSFDAFWACLEYCIQFRNKSLCTVFCDVLELILWFQEFINSGQNVAFKDALLNEESDKLNDVIEFFKLVFRNCVPLGDVRYEALNSIMTGFLDSMMKTEQKQELVRLIKNNKRKTDRILGKKLRKKLLRKMKKG